MLNTIGVELFTELPGVCIRTLAKQKLYWNNELIGGVIVIRIVIVLLEPASGEYVKSKINDTIKCSSTKSSGKARGIQCTTITVQLMNWPFVNEPSRQ